MTDNKITTEEKQLWIEEFKLYSIYAISKERTLRLYKIMELMLLVNHTAEDFSIIEDQLDNSFTRTSKLAQKVSKITKKLIELNPDFRQN